MTFDEWFPERGLADSGAMRSRATSASKASGHVYSKDGALWFKATDYGDEKDRVVERGAMASGPTLLPISLTTSTNVSAVSSS